MSYNEDEYHIRESEQAGGYIFNNTGMYGCIYSGKLLCKNTKEIYLSPTDKYHKPLTKITLKEDAEIEYSISNILRKIPIWRNYFAISEAICEPSPLQIEPDINKCNVIKKVPIKELRIISMKFNGKPIHSFNFNIKTLDLVQFVRRMLEAGALLAINGIIHRDIHHGNVVVDNFVIPRIIDFNLSIKTSIDNSKISNFLWHTYNYDLVQDSPDNMILLGVLHGHTIDSIIHDIIHKNTMILKLSVLFLIPMSTFEEEMVKFAYESKYIREKNIVNWFRTFWRVIDSWAIGALLAYKIFEFKHTYAYNRLYKYEELLFPILKKMCEIDPRKRIDCVEALNMLNPNSVVIRAFGGKEWLLRKR